MLDKKDHVDEKGPDVAYATDNLWSISDHICGLIKVQNSWVKWGPINPSKPEIKHAILLTRAELIQLESAIAAYLEATHENNI